MKILLVEDDTMLNEMISEYITSTGHMIKSSKTFKILLLDINKRWPQALDASNFQLSMNFSKHPRT